VPRYPEYSYGDELLVNGKLETPQAIEDFDYPGYLANQGIFSTMLSPKITVTAAGQRLSSAGLSLSLRDHLSQGHGGNTAGTAGGGWRRG